MTIGGWVMMLASVLSVIVLCVWCYAKVLSGDR